MADARSEQPRTSIYFPPRLLRGRRRLRSSRLGRAQVRVHQKHLGQGLCRHISLARFLMSTLDHSRDYPCRSRGTAVPQYRDRSMDTLHVLARRLDSRQVRQGKIFLAFLPYPPRRGRSARPKNEEEVPSSRLVLRESEHGIRRL